MKITQNVPIKTLTTMRLGGAAKYVIEAETIDDVKRAYDFAKNGGELSDGTTTITTAKNTKIYPLGGGANSIGLDEGFDGIILLNKIKGIEIIDQTDESVLVRAGGGEVWDDFVAWACERGYSGIEALSKIPGSCGAAPVQNIGAYGQDVSQALDHIEAYDSKTGEVVILNKTDLDFGYRRSILNHGDQVGRYFVLAITLALLQDEHLEPPFYNSLQDYLDQHKITDYSPASIRAAVSTIRGEKLPDPEKIASAGSFFKNVELKTEDEIARAKSQGLKVYETPRTDGSIRYTISSGYLIEQCGLKGKIFHGFQVSDKAALILMNVSAESYSDLEKARAEIQTAVKEKYGYDLKQEPVEIR